MLEQRERRKEQRQKVIEEIVKTEQDFLQSMHLLIEVFLGPDLEQVRDLILNTFYRQLFRICFHD